MTKWAYFNILSPRRWRAGYAGTEEFFFSCADCGDKDAEIAGIAAQSNDPSFSGIAVMGTLEEFNLRPAMFCRSCFHKRINHSDEKAERQ